MRALLESAGPLRPDWREAVDLYELLHDLELCVWFTQIGEASELPQLTEDLRARAAGTRASRLSALAPWLEPA